MTGVRWLLVTIAALLLVGVGFLLGHGVNEGEGEREREKEKREAPPPGIVRFSERERAATDIGVAPVRLRSLPTRLPVPATIEAEPSRVARVGARVAGKVERINARVGDDVPEGHLLAILSSSDVAAAHANWRQATAQLHAARQTLRRQLQLAELGAFSQGSLEEARTRYSNAHSEVVKAQNEVALSQSALQQAQAQLEVTRARFQRVEAGLVAQVVSQQDRDQASTDFQKARADVDAARARHAAANRQLYDAREREAVASAARSREEKVQRGGFAIARETLAAETAVRQAELQQQASAAAVRLAGGTPGESDGVAVRSPIAGRVVDSPVTLGQTVAATDMLFRVVDIGSVWAQLNVSSRDVAKVHPGQSVFITGDAPVRGRVLSVDAVLDPTVVTVKARATVDNSRHLLRPGTFVNGEILLEQPQSVLTVPKAAVQNINGTDVVFLATDRAGDFAIQTVQTGDEIDGDVVIRGGLKPGQRVVARNAFLVKAQSVKASLGEKD